MSYEIDLNKQGAFSAGNAIGLTTVESTPSRGMAAAHLVFYEIEAAEVVDIILDENHPEYNSPLDIGKAKVRQVISDMGKDEAILTWAKTMSPQIKDYPLKHEIVITGEYLGQLYYFQRLNIYNSPNNNSFPNISMPKIKSNVSTNKKGADYTNVAVSQTPNKTTSTDIQQLGNTFERKLNIKPLRSDEGDLILEGRFGNSIRFGSNQDTSRPTIKIRVEQSPDTPEGFINQTTENINDDGSSIWLSSDGQIQLIPATNELNNIHLVSDKTKPDSFSGRQIILASDRIVWNAKTNELMGFSKKDINFVAKDDFTIDTGGGIAAKSLADIVLTTDVNFEINAEGKTVITSPKIYFGSENAEEPVVLGNKLSDVLNELVDAILQLTVPTGTGPSGPPINSPKFQQVKNKIRTILSRQNYSL
jgi:hypothetical protein